MAEENKSPSGSEGFKVTDKRHFTRNGEAIPDQETAGPIEEKGPAPAQEAPQKEPAGKTSAETRETPGQEEPIDFTHLISFLATNALFQLGEVPDPVSQKSEVNLPAASQMIDFLSILQEKTKGNLGPQERRMLEGSLAELRTRFIRASGFGS